MTLVLPSDDSAVWMLTLIRPEKRDAHDIAIFVELAKHRDAIASSDAAVILLRAASQCSVQAQILERAKPVPAHFQGNTFATGRRPLWSAIRQGLS